MYPRYSLEGHHTSDNQWYIFNTFFFLRVIRINQRMWLKMNAKSLPLNKKYMLEMLILLEWLKMILWDIHLQAILSFKLKNVKSN